MEIQEVHWHTVVVLLHFRRFTFYVKNISPIRIDDEIKGMLAFDLWCFIKFTITVYVKSLTSKWVCNRKWYFLAWDESFWLLFCFRLFSVYIVPISYHSKESYVRFMNDGKCWKFEFSFMIQMIITFQKSNKIVFIHRILPQIY